MGKANRVASWPQYLLTDVPTDTRVRLRLVAEIEGFSLSDVVRKALCKRYRMKCPPESYRYDAGRDTGARNLLVRLQPKLYRALDRDSARREKTKRAIILEALEDYLKGEPSHE